MDEINKHGFENVDDISDLLKSFQGQSLDDLPKRTDKKGRSRDLVFEAHEQPVKKGKELVKQALELDPNNADAYNYLASIRQNLKTKMKKHITKLLILFPLVGFAQVPSGEEILTKIDDNTVAGNRSATITMIIHGRRGDRSMTLKSWVEGSEKSFSEYIAPAREKGTKMLKIGDQLWMYSPQSDRVIRIAGHMLRQSMMGSDFSYEDMMEDRSLLETYHAENLGSESYSNRDCWVIQLTAIAEDVAYYSRKIWVDKERLLPLKELRYAKSGKLLKTTETLETFELEKRWYPKHMVFKDALSKNKGTELIFDSIEFDVTIPSHLFSKASLRK